MPNWIEGTMKVRGKSKDVYRFFSEAFCLYHSSFVKVNGKTEYVSSKDESGVVIDATDGDVFAEIEIKDGCYLEKSRRGFVTGDAYIYFDDITTEKEVTKHIDFKQAWAWEPENYKTLSAKYNVDIKLVGYEMGMEYKGELEVLRGQTPTYTETKYDDWEWEAEFPGLGG